MALFLRHVLSRVSYFLWIHFFAPEISLTWDKRFPFLVMIIWYWSQQKYVSLADITGTTLRVPYPAVLVTAVHRSLITMYNLDRKSIAQLSVRWKYSPISRKHHRLHCGGLGMDK